MRERKSQVGSEISDKTKEETGKVGGLEFMSRRFNVVNQVFELAVTKKITPAERNLIDLIEIGTTGAMNEKRQFCTKAEFYLEDLSSALRYKEKAKIWRLLKSLHTKGIITREKTRSKNKELIGLNPEMMGQILTNHLHEEERKRHLKLAVNNSVIDVDNFKNERTNREAATNESCAVNFQTVRADSTNRAQSDSQSSVIIEEKPLLDSSRLILDSSRGKNPIQSFTLLEKSDAEKAEEAKAIIRGMAGMFKSMSR